MSIATEITRLQAAKASIKSAIEAKGVTVPSSTTLEGYPALIAGIESGGYPAWLKDGDTHLWIDISNDYQLDQQLRLRMIGTIDWGDGTTESINVTAYTTKTHTYASTGKYRIDLKPTSGTFYLGGASNSYSVMGTISARHNITCCLYQAEIGTKQITLISGYAFYYCRGLIRAYVPKTITSFGGNSSFAYCYSLKEVEFEDYTTFTGTTCPYTFYYDYCLQDISGFAPSSLTSMNYTFRSCLCMSEITIPANVTSLGARAFDSVSGLKKLKCLPTTPPTVSNENTFTSFPSGCVIEVPAGSLEDYQAETNWSTYASQMVEASS